MSFHLRAVTSNAIKALPILAAALTLSLALPGHAVNAATISGTVGTVGAAPPPPGPYAYPDLTVSITKELSSWGQLYDPFGLGSLTYSHRVILHTIVRNLGFGPSGPTQLDVNGNRQTVPGLQPGTSITIDWPIQDCGFFMAVVDPDNRVVESNEGNNWTQAQCA